MPLPRGAVLCATSSNWRALRLRGSSRDIAEAGRELGRFDARPWLSELRQPSAVVLTRSDTAVPPRWQRNLAAGLGAPVFESPGDHFASGLEAEGFNAALLGALRRVAPPSEMSRAA